MEPQHRLNVGSSSVHSVTPLRFLHLKVKLCDMPAMNEDREMDHIDFRISMPKTSPEDSLVVTHASENDQIELPRFLSWEMTQLIERYRRQHDVPEAPERVELP
jgi:hypothetical protein